MGAPCGSQVILFILIVMLGAHILCLHVIDEKCLYENLCTKVLNFDSSQVYPDVRHY